ncbi:hypothetical protein [Shinella pollutisoli]|uniref:Uncharacterized protein n=1 Tax=Shinella pollutisoli TaxID=2250594 RepID=A0ABV7D9M8_9HYPH|nr:hypothetical protein [Shinella pollutisoli]
MRYNELLIDERLDEIDDGPFQITIETIFDDESCSVDYFIRIMKPDNSPLCVLSLRGTVTNPLDVSAVVTVAAGYYGICVASGMLGAVGKAAFQSYEAAKKEMPEASRTDKARRVWKGTLEKKSELKAEAAKSLTGCVTKIFGA